MIGSIIIIICNHLIRGVHVIIVAERDRPRKSVSIGGVFARLPDRRAARGACIVFLRDVAARVIGEAVIHRAV